MHHLKSNFPLMKPPRFRPFRFFIPPLHFYVLLFALIAPAFSAQHKKLDSLRSAYTRAEHDTTRFILLLRIGNIFQKSDHDSAVYYHKLSHDIARKLKDRVREGHAILQSGMDHYLKGNTRQAVKLFALASGIGRQYILSGNNEQLSEAKKLYAGALTNLAVVSKEQGDYHKAIKQNLTAMQLFDEAGFVNGHMGALGNIGNIYYDMGNYPMALEYNFKALKIAEENKNSKGKAINLVNIGSIYNYQGEYEKALEYYNRALKIYESKKNLRDRASVLGVIAQVYTGKKDYSKALEYCFMALDIHQKTGISFNESLIWGQIGLAYSCRGDSAIEKGDKGLALEIFYPKALEYYTLAIKAHEKSGNKSFLASDLGNLGDLYTSMQKYTLAEETLKKGLALSTKLGAAEEMKDHAFNLSRLYEATNRTTEAFGFYKEYIRLRDSVYSTETAKKTARLEIKYTYEKKATADSTKAAEEKKSFDIKLEASESRLRQEKIIKSLLYGGLAIVIVLALFIFNRFKITQKQKNIIETQKELVDSKNQIITQKQKEILDSIHYAERIQKAHLPSDKYIVRNLEKLKK
jgi:tetratricopeptide (TPR) repeat protein